MSIVYTNQPIRLKITAKLEMEDGQTFSFNQESDNFDEDTIATLCDDLSSEIYDKLDEFLEEPEGGDDYDLPHNDDFVDYNEN